MDTKTFYMLLDKRKKKEIADEDKEKKLRFRIAGETVNFADLEKFLVSAHPKVLKDVLQVTEAEAMVSASLARTVPPDVMKIAIAFMIVMMVLIIGVIALKNYGILHI
ncbi:MAG: hypothetical protein DRN25_04515 [Thermoplasmata archaeon]|nr:MAG: hypothetical protein DRN25_04515 [Thermoplasmata archaeon]